MSPFSSGTNRDEAGWEGEAPPEPPREAGSDGASPSRLPRLPEVGSCLPAGGPPGAGQGKQTMLLANSRRGSLGRKPGKMRRAGEAKPRFAGARDEFADSISNGTENRRKPVAEPPTGLVRCGARLGGLLGDRLGLVLYRLAPTLQ
jgi:hypothetical protein